MTRLHVFKNASAILFIFVYLESFVPFANFALVILGIALEKVNVILGEMYLLVSLALATLPVTFTPPWTTSRFEISRHFSHE
jgi:hypothetical protein